MPVINHVKKEINAKIVYFGPASAGKTTSVNYIHSKLKHDCRGELKDSGSRDARLHFFDFMPHEIGSVDGYRVRFHIYTVTGEVSSPATWKMVLKGADGVVFVADADPERYETNKKHFDLLQEQLQISSMSPEDIPLVVQMNKVDMLSQPVPEDTVAMFRKEGIEVIPSVAKHGEGVLAAVSLLVKRIMRAIRNEGVQVLEPEPLDEGAADLVTSGFVDNIRDGEFFAAAGGSVGCDVAMAQIANAAAGVAVVVDGKPEQVAEAAIELPLAVTLADGTRVSLRLTLNVGVSGNE